MIRFAASIGSAGSLRFGSLSDFDLFMEEL